MSWQVGSEEEATDIKKALLVVIVTLALYLHIYGYLIIFCHPAGCCRRRGMLSSYIMNHRIAYDNYAAIVRSMTTLVIITLQAQY